MCCVACKGFGTVVEPVVPLECQRMMPEIQEVLSEGSLVLHYKNGLTGLVRFPECSVCRGRGQLRRQDTWLHVARWAAETGFRFPDVRAARYRGSVVRAGVSYACCTASGTL